MESDLLPLMSMRVFSLVLLFAALASARNPQENWLELSSPHFTVVCNGKEKDARTIADQFERMRLVFHTGFPNLQIDPSAPIIVIAVKDAKSFRALEPEAYLKKGQLELDGLFLRAPDKNYVLLRTGAGGEHPYATVYHEYTHLLFSKAEWMPLWLNEGLAEFYQNTDISEKGTVLGQPDVNELRWLQQNRLLPLATLFAVDRNSPYYHEEQKGSAFYAESWALTHYLQVRDFQNHTNKITDYILLTGNQMDAVTAASRAFGDLKQLQSALESYLRSNLAAFRLNRALAVEDSRFTLQTLTPAQADAVRADFLAYNQRETDSRNLLQQVLQEDPNNTLAHEAMGYLEFRAAHLEQSQHWYQQAVQLGSQSYLAHYYFAAIAMNRGQSGADIDRQIENSLQKAIQFNPSFAPAYDQLAIFYGMRAKNLDQAHMLTLQAVQLDPANVRYRITAARILLTMGRETDATKVLQATMKLAKTAEEIAVVQQQLQVVQQMQSAREQNEEEARRFHEAEAAAKQSQAETADPGPQLTEHTLKGPRRTIAGTIKNVHCAAPAIMDLDVDAGGKTITLHTGNYYKVAFSALNFKPTADLRPCSDLGGMHAKAEYVESVATKTNGLVAIQLSK